MSVGCVYMRSLFEEYYIHIGVGFEVAYLSELGKFDGLKSEISNKYGSHAFIV